jgi:membrane dipeptidase
MPIVDAHLDLSYNALRGREVTRPAREQTADEEGVPTVGLPDLRAGGVGLICATVFTMPSVEGKPGYRTVEEAHAEAERHLDWYQQQVAEGRVRFVTNGDELAAESNESQRAVLLMEGADPLRNADDVAAWHAAGMRIVGLAWKRTRFAGGTGAPGPLTSDGVEMVKILDRFDIIHDTSHLAEESFWQLLKITSGPVIASHSNCRAIVPTDRQLSDEMIRAIIARGGVIGINFFDRFLLPPGQYGKRRATLADVASHVRRICDLAGNVNHVGLGTDMDGGLGRNEIPVEIETSADLPRVAEALSAAGFDDDAVRGVMGENWMRFFRRSLPRGRS